MTCTPIDTMVCLNETLQHPRFYPRQLITPTELTLEHDYLHDMLRRHNRLLHGWGVVCGAAVDLSHAADGSVEKWAVVVKPGYVLGPYGDEIVIGGDYRLDLRGEGTSGSASDLGYGQPDPWCSDVTVTRTPGALYVAVRYREVMARPVKAQPAGCGCDDSRCEYSRLCDGFEIQALDQAPDGPANGLDPDKATLKDLIHATLDACPACPDSPWVVLAKVEFDADGTIKSPIENCTYRRIALSFANVWLMCK
jgi:hypothetical protein